jgi:hypothetical protein
MTQYTKHKSIPKNVVQKVFAVLVGAGLVFGNICKAETQFDVSGSLISGTNNSSNVDAVSSATKSNKSIFNGSMKYNGLYNLSPKLLLVLQENYDGVIPLGYTKDTLITSTYPPVSEKLVPSSNNATVGLRLLAYGDIQLLVRNLLYFDPTPIGPDYLGYMDRPIYDSTISDNGMTIKRKSRTNVNLFLTVPVSKFELVADVNYFGLNSMRTANGMKYISDTVFPVDTVIETRNMTESDLLSYFSVRYPIPADMRINIGAYLKQNFSGHAFMNLYQYELLLQGNHIFPSDNKITWSTGLELYNRSSNTLWPEGYSDANQFHFSATPIYKLYLRDVYTLDWGFFLKSIIMLDLGKDLYKQRYELSLRKAWQNESSIDFGYFNALGGLFPMQGIFVRGIYRPAPLFSIALNSKSEWEGPDKFLDKVSYLKTIVNLELGYIFKTHYEFTVGGDYTYYNTELSIPKEFPGRLGFYAGIKGWL